jgi:hypothetical protein
MRPNIHIGATINIVLIGKAGRRQKIGEIYTGFLLGRFSHRKQKNLENVE